MYKQRLVAIMNKVHTLSIELLCVAALLTLVCLGGCMHVLSVNVGMHHTVSSCQMYSQKCPQSVHSPANPSLPLIPSTVESARPACVLVKELVVAPHTCLFATMTALSIVIKFTQFRTTPSSSLCAEPHQLMQGANPMPQFCQFCRERESKYEKRFYDAPR